MSALANIQLPSTIPSCVLRPTEETKRSRPALVRFAEKCRFDPRTGCVIWTGGTTRGRGNSATYGSFWFEGKRWFAHRWAGVFIHGLDLDGKQGGHCCPYTPDGHPNTLCVEHVIGQTQAENLAEQMARGSGVCGVEQSPEERQYWMFVERGYEPDPPITDPTFPNPYTGSDMHPPEWLLPFMGKRRD